MQALSFSHLLGLCCQATAGAPSNRKKKAELVVQRNQANTGRWQRKGAYNHDYYTKSLLWLLNLLLYLGTRGPFSTCFKRQKLVI